MPDGGAGATVTRVPLYVVSFAVGDPNPIPDELLIEVTIDDVEHVLLRLDSAAPATSTTAADAAALGLTFGDHDVWIGDRATGVHLGRRTLVDVEAVGDGLVSGAGLPAGSVLRGTAGTDLWQGYAIGLDLRGGALWMMPHAGALTAADVAAPDGTGAAIAVPASFLRHAGDAGGVLYASASFDAHGAAGTFLVDTGTSTNLALGSYFRRVTPASPRSLPADSTDFQGARLVGAYRLGSAYTLGGQTLDDLQAVWVLDAFPTLAAEAQYYAEPTDGLIGLWGLVPYFAVLDFGAPAAPATAARIFLFPYVPAPESVLAKNFSGFAFTVASDLTVQVVDGSLTAEAGVKSGDTLVAVGGAAGYAWLSSGIIGGRAGETRPFTFARAGTRYDVALTAERVLGP